MPSACVNATVTESPSSSFVVKLTTSAPSTVAAASSVNSVTSPIVSSGASLASTVSVTATVTGVPLKLLASVGVNVKSGKSLPALIKSTPDCVNTTAVLSAFKA